MSTTSKVHKLCVCVRAGELCGVSSLGQESWHGQGPQLRTPVCARRARNLYWLGWVVLVSLESGRFCFLGLKGGTSKRATYTRACDCTISHAHSKSGNEGENRFHSNDQDAIQLIELCAKRNEKKLVPATPRTPTPTLPYE